MNDYTVKPLDTTTWPAFAQLAERHNGVWNGGWCTWVDPAWAKKRPSFTTVPAASSSGPGSSTNDRRASTTASCG